MPQRGAYGLFWDGTDWVPVQLFEVDDANPFDVLQEIAEFTNSATLTQNMVRSSNELLSNAIQEAAKLKHLPSNLPANAKERHDLCLNAVEKSQLNLVQALLPDIDLTFANEDCGNPLHVDALAGRADIVSCLVEARANVNSQSHPWNQPWNNGLAFLRKICMK